MTRNSWIVKRDEMRKYNYKNYFLERNAFQCSLLSNWAYTQHFYSRCESIKKHKAATHLKLVKIVKYFATFSYFSMDSFLLTLPAWQHIVTAAATEKEKSGGPQFKVA